MAHKFNDPARLQKYPLAELTYRIAIELWLELSENPQLLSQKYMVDSRIDYIDKQQQITREVLTLHL